MGHLKTKQRLSVGGGAFSRGSLRETRKALRGRVTNEREMMREGMG